MYIIVVYHQQVKVVAGEQECNNEEGTWFL